MQYGNLKGFTEHTDDLVAKLKAVKGKVVDLQPLFFQFTLATTTALIFGQPVKSFESEEQTRFATDFDNASAIFALRMRLDKLYWLYTPPTYRKACAYVKTYASALIDQALGRKKDDTTSTDSDDESTNKYAFIEDLYEELKDPMLVRDQICNVLIAGRDTTACLLSWTL